ncbi:uncharacterized protein LOC129777822 [Toxorhynchites rutilus septentrionalis]|uniref:uncharacterized protein LOC129777822 n=1 Tax=Toxorhynchites rutilus septentrionalis TaxID=329112 RepID=UPI0024783D36|nr:uncharacterized protein LOC129777822 [Toxorhynchites rutilus septentrionalis]
MAPVVDGNQFELPVVETPGKKRRRNAETNPFYPFSDQTFCIPSSTPIHNKQVDGSAFENASFRYNSSNKENYNIFSDSFMEVKSIADLASAAGDNPFEVVRKPPAKKKKKDADFEESCFVNPGLNLNSVDKPSVNPFEVVRNEETAKRENESCFINGALNIKSKDNVANPFEIVRPVAAKAEDGGAVEEKSTSEGLKGIENPGLEIPTFALAVPFTPSINRRINFQDLPPNALTPCQMLAKNLVFSPDPSQGSNLITPKRDATTTRRQSLSVISEEPLDIGEELDCYQLELENSINEAKVRKQKTVGAGSTGKRKVRRSLIDNKHISNLSMKLKQLEDSDNEEEAKSGEPKLKTDSLVEAEVIEEASPTTQITFTVVKETTTVSKEEIRINVTNPDVQFEEVDDFEDEEQDVDLFANPAPFQRAYRKKEDPKPTDGFKEPEVPEIDNIAGKSYKVKDVIRRSIRKLIHAKSQEQITTDLDDERPKTEESHGFISTIRHSLRRKNHKIISTKQKEEQEREAVLETSIIVEAPRVVFKQPSNKQYKPIAGSSVEKVGSTLRSSLRRSTKDMKKQMMKNVFKKAAEEKE